MYMRFASVVDKVGPAYNKVAEKVVPISEKVYEQAGVAGHAVRHGAEAAYRMALKHPKTSIGGAILAAAVIGGLLWYMFGNSRQPVQRRRTGPRVRAVSERRAKRGRAHATA
jgi:hypothetical protein